ncbi:beta-galactosidase [Massilia sp. Root133]|uniref:beta-galactosidase n=1 Tax=Massilia cellulosiltytica TaxID=2683234 RepID=A0A7X3KBX1_9BURK|nr:MULTISPECIES: beta-galactosidase [Telluria group]KQY04188.1 beta-galactosidase [Massilia sp. Root133]KQZ42382.1 beta-galactosidase [Massilia sp. Root1485]MVW64516.1 cellulase family glycosylhydrolase [Telluria cellulosilytica]
MKLIAKIAFALATLAGPASLPLAAPAGWPGPGQLFVGTCYQPVDRTPDQIQRDIALMKKAGFNVVRMGDLSWDYFEPEDGKFKFEEFDRIVDAMQANGIKVIVDIPGTPAPLWLHHKYPGVNLVNAQGATVQPAERYMLDISDPDYRRHAVRLAEKLTQRYGKHPAVIAIGFDNEIGNTFMSYSKADRTRFVAWLKRKYGTLDALNQAWATQRWSRHLSSWDEVELPYADGPGPAERNLDLRRFWSDNTIAVLKDLEAVRVKYGPDKPAISNLWDSAGRKGFDYLSTYRQYAHYGAMGFYPGEPVGSGFEALMMKAGLDTPIWFNEFTAGGGGYYGTKGRSRMWAHFGLLLGAQSVMAWTYNSHLGGEEQALMGLLDHDSKPSWKLWEFGTIAREFKTLQTLGFPRHTEPQVAFAYSFDSRNASTPPGPSNTMRQYFTIPYMDQIHNAFAPIFNDNIDTAVIHVGHDDLRRYKMVVVAADVLMDKASADALRRYVQDGGTVVMTAFSAKVSETGQWFDTPLPGRLSDVFGLRTSEYYNADAPLDVGFDGKTVTTTTKFYEVLEPSTAKVVARLTNVPDAPPAITENRYGKGRAIYVATAAQRPVMQALYRSLYGELGIKRGPATPEGVYAREVDGRTLYVNTTTQPQDVKFDGTATGVLGGRAWSGTLRLEPFGAELLRK